jgi:putative CocE/NonD family hydrolase
MPRFPRRVTVPGIVPWWVWALPAVLVLSAVAAAALWRLKPDSRWHGQVLALWHGVRVDADVPIRMPDGTVLRADVLRPRGDERRPTVLIRTPYMKEGERFMHGDALRFAREGYAVVVQDLRGRFASQGEFAPWAHADSDGRATLDWIVTQPWSNGRVGGWGTSALGETQLVLAKTRDPALRALAPNSAGGALGSALGRHGYFGVFEGGVLNLASAAGWFATYGAKRPPSKMPDPPIDIAALRHLPVRDIVARLTPRPTDYEAFLDTPLGDPRWDELAYLNDNDRFDVPALHLNGWFDQGVSQTLAIARLMAERSDSPRGRDNQFIVIGPGTHSTLGRGMPLEQVGDLPTPGGQIDLAPLVVRWFDHWLRGEAAQAFQAPKVQFYVMGEGRWAQSDTWPPPGVTRQRWYLDGAGRAQGRDGDGRLSLEHPAGAAAVDRFRYDPMDPVPTRGGAFCCTGDAHAREGPVDQHDVESRPDVLVYTSPPLTKPIRLAGPIVVELVVATSARDTDFTAKLVDVAPDGRALNIRDSVLRLRYRDGIVRPQPAEPGRRYRIRIALGDIAWTVGQGHRLRLQVSSSNFPRLERNLNTGGTNHTEKASISADNEVWHGRDVMSFVELPVWGGGH